MNTGKIIRGLAGVVAVIVVFALVLNWVGDYRQAASSVDKASASETPQSTPTSDESSKSVNKTPAKGTSADQPKVQVLVVAVDGLNFRAEPNGQSRARRGLSKGEKLTLLATEGDWYKVRDSNQIVGYITSSPTYTDLQK